MAGFRLYVSSYSAAEKTTCLPAVPYATVAGEMCIHQSLYCWDHVQGALPVRVATACSAVGEIICGGPTQWRRR
jgi:hypothetical protein